MSDEISLLPQLYIILKEVKHLSEYQDKVLIRSTTLSVNNKTYSFEKIASPPENINPSTVSARSNGTILFCFIGILSDNLVTVMNAYLIIRIVHSRVQNKSFNITRQYFFRDSER